MSIYIFNEDYTQMLEVDEEQFTHLVEAVEYEDGKYSLEYDLFNILSVGMKQQPKVVVGETEEGDLITFEEDDRVLN